MSKLYRKEILKEADQPGGFVALGEIGGLVPAWAASSPWQFPPPATSKLYPPPSPKPTKKTWSPATSSTSEPAIQKATRKGGLFARPLPWQMARLLQLVETEDAVQLKLPPQQRVLVVLPLTLLITMFAFGFLWWTWQWLTSEAVLQQGFSEISAFVLLFLTITATRTLLLELSTPTLTFERTTIEVRKALFGLSVSRQWYLCYRVQQFRVTQLARYPDQLRLDAITDKNRSRRPRRARADRHLHSTGPSCPPQRLCLLPRRRPGMSHVWRSYVLNST